MDVQEPGRIHFLGDSNGNPRGTPSADVRRFTSVAKADFLQQLYAGLRPSKPKSGLPGGLKGLLHPHGDTATLDAL